MDCFRRQRSTAWWSPEAEDLRHFLPLPGFRAGVLGVLQKTVPMALPHVAGRVRQHAGHQAAHRVRHRHGGDLPAGENKVSQGELLVHTSGDKPLVDSLIMAADQHQVVIVPDQALCRLLGEGGPLGAHVDDPAAARAPCCQNIVQAGFQGLGHEHAAKAAPIGVIIHLALFVGGYSPGSGRSGCPGCPFSPPGPGCSPPARRRPCPGTGS